MASFFGISQPPTSLTTKQDEMQIQQIKQETFDDILFIQDILHNLKNKITDENIKQTEEYREIRKLLQHHINEDFLHFFCVFYLELPKTKIGQSFTMNNGQAGGNNKHSAFHFALMLVVLLLGLFTSFTVYKETSELIENIVNPIKTNRNPLMKSNSFLRIRRIPTINLLTNGSKQNNDSNEKAITLFEEHENHEIQEYVNNINEINVNMNAIYTDLHEINILESGNLSVYDFILSHFSGKGQLIGAMIINNNVELIQQHINSHIQAVQQIMKENIEKSLNDLTQKEDLSFFKRHLDAVSSLMDPYSFVKQKGNKRMIDLNHNINEFIKELHRYMQDTISNTRYSVDQRFQEIEESVSRIYRGTIFSLFMTTSGLVYLYRYYKAMKPQLRALQNGRSYGGSRRNRNNKQKHKQQLLTTKTRKTKTNGKTKKLRRSRNVSMSSHRRQYQQKQKRQTNKK